MTASLKMRVTSTSATSFRTTTSRRIWCRRYGIIFSGLFFVLLWLSGHNKRLGRKSFKFVFLILRWQKEEGRHKKEEVSLLRLQECWPSFVGHLFSGHRLLPSICLCGHLYKSSYRFGVENLGYTRPGYNLDDQILDIHCVFQYACIMMMYSATI